ncbi:MAG: MFS transporter [Candidatus Nanoarchaeia archaeon]|nr:MFS transporter [Candidatus Nanoarchaeia archaeon]
MKINKKIRILLYGAGIWYLAEGMLGPLFAVFTERIGGDVLEISWAWATYLIVAGVFYMIIGELIDTKYDKARVMVLGYALNAIFTFGYLLVSAPWHLFVVQTGLGFAAALANPTWNALYAKYEDKKHDGFEWGLAGGEAQILMGLALIAGGFIVTYLSFKTLFLTMGIIQVIATIYQAQLLKEIKHPKQS